jgi:hypothetical protein
MFRLCSSLKICRAAGRTHIYLFYHAASAYFNLPGTGWARQPMDKRRPLWYNHHEMMIILGFQPLFSRLTAEPKSMA